MLKKRYLYSHLASDLKEKMVFVGGPRQVGKTTLAQFIGKNNYQRPVYLNWDFREDRKKILDEKFESEADLIIFDEIHKYKNWRNYLKGEFDKNNERLDRIVREDIRDIENVRDLSSLQVLVEILPGRVGSLFSANSLKEDLGVTHKTISLWLDVLERFYYHFRIYPFTSTTIRS